MLRDEGGRLADEDSQVYIGAAPAQGAYDFDFDEGPASVSAPPKPAPRPDVPAKPAVVVGIAQANSRRDRKQKPSVAPPPPPPTRSAPRTAPPPVRAQPQPRRAVPPPFSEEPTRQVDDELLTALRQGEIASPRPTPSFNEEPTRLAPQMAPMRLEDSGQFTNRDPLSPKFPPNTPATDPNMPGVDQFEEKTSIASLDSIAAMERARHQGNANDERTRAVNIRNDPSISDIDWDLD
jgi:hypothetical protein